MGDLCLEKIASKGFTKTNIQTLLELVEGCECGKIYKL